MKIYNLTMKDGMVTLITDEGTLQIERQEAVSLAYDILAEDQDAAYEDAKENY